MRVGWDWVHDAWSERSEARVRVQRLNVFLHSHHIRKYAYLDVISYSSPVF